MHRTQHGHARPPCLSCSDHGLTGRRPTWPPSCTQVGACGILEHLCEPSPQCHVHRPLQKDRGFTERAPRSPRLSSPWGSWCPDLGVYGPCRGQFLLSSGRPSTALPSVLPRKHRACRVGALSNLGGHSDIMFLLPPTPGGLSSFLRHSNVCSGPSPGPLPSRVLSHRSHSNLVVPMKCVSGE